LTCIPGHIEDEVRSIVIVLSRLPLLSFHDAFGGFGRGYVFEVKTNFGDNSKLDKVTGIIVVVLVLEIPE
jgi:hypothetical protein